MHAYWAADKISSKSIGLFGLTCKKESHEVRGEAL